MRYKGSKIFRGVQVNNSVKSLSRTLGAILCMFLHQLSKFSCIFCFKTYYTHGPHAAMANPIFLTGWGSHFFKFAYSF